MSDPVWTRVLGLAFLIRLLDESIVSDDVDVSPPEEVIHLLIRYRDSVPGIDTIGEHQKLLDEHGAVWFGKFGKPIGTGSVERMQRQIAQGAPTFVYLTTRHDGGQLRVHRAQIAQLRYEAPAAAEFDVLVPKYYRSLGLRSNVRLWARLFGLEAISEDQLDTLIVASSRRPVRHSLRSTAPFLLLVEQGGQAGN